MVREARLDPLQLVLAGTALELAVFLSEIPTGVLADVYGRRLSVIVGTVVSAAGFALIGASPTFLFIAGGQIVWGVGWTFISGANDAWLTDETSEQAAAPVFVRATQMVSAGRLAGVPAGVALALASLRLPYFVGGAVLLLAALLLALVMTERGFTPHGGASRRSWRAMTSTLRAGLGVVRVRSVVGTILVVELLFGASSEAFDRLTPLLLIDHIGLPSALDAVAWFGVLGAGSVVGAIAATWLAGRATDLADARAIVRTLLALTAVVTVASLVFALAGAFWLALAAIWAVGWVRVAIDPLMLAWLNRGLDPASRATVLSMLGQSNALGQVGGGPLLGLVGRLSTVRAALVGVSVLLAPTLPLFGRELRRPPDTEAGSGDG